MTSADGNEGQSPKQKKAVHRTQWAAQFAVASELCKRGYEVSFTMGNATPLADLMVVSPTRKLMFLVDVKGLYRPNSWIIKRKQARASLFYILAFVPPDAANRFFILTHEQVNAYIHQELVRLRRPDDYRTTGIVLQQVRNHENDWRILPA